MSLEKNDYFCGVLPDDDNIDFWSMHFNEYVFRLASEGRITKANIEKFLKAEEGFNCEVLSSGDGFRRKIFANHIIH